MRESNLEDSRQVNRFGRPRAFDTIFYGGIAIGILDLTFAFTFYGLILGAKPLRIFQSVAGGVLGRPAALEGGVRTFLLGIVLHFVVATCIAAVYYLATHVLPALIRHAVISGLSYGVVAYFGMKYIVVPLSAIGQRGPLPRLPILVTEVIGHAVLVGLPVALLAQRSAKTNGKRQSDSISPEPSLEPT
ncbi:MAG TPA: hypothetical protein VLB68_14140 [Pyrinomonadaceae bacterium]|nr:hypothetical protein [Pyrinomonadaceae bacterium]